MKDYVHKTASNMRTLLNRNTLFVAEGIRNTNTSSTVRSMIVLEQQCNRCKRNLNVDVAPHSLLTTNLVYTAGVLIERSNNISVGYHYLLAPWGWVMLVLMRLANPHTPLLLCIWAVDNYYHTVCPQTRLYTNLLCSLFHNDIIIMLIQLCTLPTCSYSICDCVYYVYIQLY